MKTNFQSSSRFLLVLFVLAGSFLLTIKTECQPTKLDLKKLPDRGIYKMHLKNIELEDRDKTIAMLNQKEIEYQRRISDLEEKVKSLINK